MREIGEILVPIVVRLGLMPGFLSRQSSRPLLAHYPCEAFEHDATTGPEKGVNPRPPRPCVVAFRSLRREILDIRQPAYGKPLASAAKRRRLTPDEGGSSLSFVAGDARFEITGLK